jgi:hypothetical protein
LHVLMVNDKGRYRQLRARSQSPELFHPEPPAEYRNLGRAARNQPRWTELEPPLFERGLRIVDVNVLYRYLSKISHHVLELDSEERLRVIKWPE